MDRTWRCAAGIFCWLVSTAVLPQSVDAQQSSRSGLERVVTGEAVRLSHADVDLLRIRFEAGARTHWHTHEHAQIYLVEEGRGRIQIQGQEIRDVAPGEAVYMPPNVPHWHGASPDEAATCLHAYPGGVAITMMDEVTKEEYLGQTATTR